MLDGLRQEELDRFKKAFIQHISNSTQRTKTKEELILQYKGYVEGAAHPILDSVFGGILQQSIKCLNCGYISIHYEPFLDLSLSILRPKTNNIVQYSKKEQKQVEQTDNSDNECSNFLQKNRNGKSKNLKKKELKNKKKVFFLIIMNILKHKI